MDPLRITQLSFAVGGIDRYLDQSVSPTGLAGIVDACVRAQDRLHRGLRIDQAGSAETEGAGPSLWSDPIWSR